MSTERMTKIAVTGAGGFLGSNLIEALGESAHTLVYALSSRGEELCRSNQRENLRYRHKDAIFEREGEEILPGAIVVNCAFPRNSAGAEMADGLRYIQRLFDRAKECGAAAVINISSQSVYSQKRLEPATEDTPVCLESPYAVGKYATELMLESACRGTQIAYTNLRMASLIGPGFDQRIVNRLIKRALAGETIRAVRSERRFGFFDIADAVASICALIASENRSWRQVYNIGEVKGYTVCEIVDCIADVFRQYQVPMPEILVDVGEEWGNTAVDSRRFNEDFGFSPSVNLRESVKKIYLAE